MTDEPTHDPEPTPTDDLASAQLDGELDAAELDVAANPAVTERAAEFGAIQRAMRADLTTPSAGARDAMIARAVQAGSPATTGDELTARRARRTARPMAALATAAAVAIGLAVVGIAVSSTGDDSDSVAGPVADDRSAGTDAATESAGDSVGEDPAGDGDTGAPAPAAGTDSPATTRDGVDTGALDAGAAFRLSADLAADESLLDQLDEEPLTADAEADLRREANEYQAVCGATVDHRVDRLGIGVDGGVDVYIAIRLAGTTIAEATTVAVDDCRVVRTEAR